MSDLESDSFEMDTSCSNQEKLVVPKRPQVYSSYVQSEYTTEQPQPKTSNSNKTYIKHQTKKQENNIKKPKYTEPEFVPQLVQNRSLLNITEITEENETFTLQPIIGLNTFKSENVFFINDTYALISLDDCATSKYNQFCFKGKCSIAIVNGHLDIAGFSLKRNIADKTDLKWYDIYSPETNSFVRISNKLESNSSGMDSSIENLYSSLVDLIKQLTKQADVQSHDLALKQFLTQVSSMAASLFLVGNLNSHMCNYMSYIDNFKQIYQMQYADLKELSDTDRSFAQLGLFPIHNSYQTESDQDRAVCNEILNFNQESTSESKLRSLDQNSQGSNSQVIMACGGKDVGKSTFLRYMVNSFLNKYKSVAYLDCDPGQCEYNLAGCISMNIISEPIFGPPHTHVNHNPSTKSCYFLGYLSPNDVPNHYLHCIKKCYEDYCNFMKSSKEPVPLVVNTMGWNNGLGLCLLKDILLIFKPTHVIQINHSKDANKNLPVLDKIWLSTQDAASPENKFKNLITNKPVSPEKFDDSLMHMDEDNKQFDDSSFSDLYTDINYKLLVLKSNAPIKTPHVQIQQKHYKPIDHRNISIISYFAPLQDPNTHFQSIHNLRPYKVSWSKFAIHCAHARVEYNHLFRVMNASLVGLCVVEEKYIQRRDSYLPGVLQVFDHQNRKPVVYNCNGFGIIRGINMETKEFYILTPEQPINLANVNLLVKGQLNLPNEFFYEQDSETFSPYMSLSDNLQKQKENMVGNAPVHRRYLIHQPNSQNK